MWSVLITDKEVEAPSMGLSTALQVSSGRAALWLILEENRIDFLHWCVCHERSQQS